MKNFANFPLQDVYFLIFWVTPIALIVFYYVKSLFESDNGNIDLSRQVNTVPSEKPTSPHRKLLPNPVFMNIFSLTVLAVFICSYISLILYHEYFGGLDQSQLILTTLNDKFYGPPIWKDQARFWPLGMQEFNVIRFLTKSPSGYHVLPIVQILAIIAGTFILLRKLPIWFRAWTVIYFFTIPSTTGPFFDLIVPERNVIFWLTIFLVCFQNFCKTRSAHFFCSALISAHIALYYKEPVFLLVRIQVRGLTSAPMSVA